MKFKTILNGIFSISIGAYFACFYTYLSGMNHYAEELLTAAILIMCIWTIVSIYLEPNEQSQKIQLFIFIMAISIGLYKAKIDADTYREADYIQHRRSN